MTPMTPETSAPPIRLVHAGARGRGRWPIDLVRDDTRFESVALVGRHPELLTDALDAAGLDADAAHVDLATALEHTECDAVVVATPVELHARDLRIAFDAGKHVLVEKCLSNDWAEANDLVDAAERAGVRLLVAQNYRFAPDWRALAGAVASGTHGEIGLVHLTAHKYRPAPRQQDYPLAVFWDQGCHHVDALQMILGPVAEVTAHTYSTPWSRYRDDAAVLAVLRFESGATWVYDLSNLVRRFHVAVSLHSTHGALVLDEPLGRNRWLWYATASSDDAAFGWNEEPVEVPVPPGPPTGEHGVLDAFHDALVHGAATDIDGRANLETLRVCEMVRRSVDLGRTVERTEV